MVEANPAGYYENDDDEWGDDGEQEDWDDWDQAEVGVDFEQPDFGRQASDFENASQIYSTKQRLDIKFVDKRQIERILEQRIA